MGLFCPPTLSLPKIGKETKVRKKSIIKSTSNVSWTYNNQSRTSVSVSLIAKKQICITKIIGNSEIISIKELLGIISKTPCQTQFSKWINIYNSNINGFSFQTFEDATKYCENGILLCKDQNNNIFGAFIAGKWHVNKGKNSHYDGDRGECFLFKYVVNTWTNKLKLKSYHGSGVNDFYLHIKKNQHVIIGEGESSGIYIDGDLLHGRSSKSKTFNNDILTSSQDGSFEIQNIELWYPIN
mmetsp:Transcript_36902/g.45599  ORF Transcript_36902/g.45599 Transcript_36902/m.45599 type:complete len:240 (-) Transcript_36902:102-821(-)